MSWNKINLRIKNKNLPEIGERVIWATNQDSPDEKVFHKFIGSLGKDGKYVDSGYKKYKLTSKFWWQHLSNDPIEKDNIMKVYVIEVMTLGGLYPVIKVSQKAYSTYELAKEFCSNRSDAPIQIDDYNWKSDRYKYSILILDVQ